MASQPSICEGFWDLVNISDIKDAESFTLRLGGSQKEFEEMMCKIQESCAKSSTPPAAVSTTTPLLAQFSFDNVWYRAEVKDVNSDGSVQVSYVDYGNGESVQKRNTRPNTAFLSLPRQSVECRLHRIDYSRPLGSEHHGSFKSLCLNRTFKALFVNKQIPSCWNVELFHETGNVNDWFGKQTGKLLGPLEKLTIPSKLPHPHNAGLEPAKEVTQPPRKNEINRAASNAHLQARPVANKFTGTVVYITSPTQFWLLNSVDDDTVMGIGAELAEHCNSSSMQRLRSPSVGQLCAALYDEDNTWYRGVVTKLLDGNNVQIQFIDYGNTSIVSCDNLAQVSADSLHAPGYAVEASLHQLSPPSGESWSEGALQAFSDLVLESQCDVEVINKSSQSTYSVDLRIQGTSVAQKLVEEGVAVRQQQQRSPAPSTQHTPSPGSSKPASVYQGSFSSQLVDSQQKEFVFISWVVNPQEFWVQKDGCEGQLEALFTSAKESADNTRPLSDPTVGMPCIAKYPADNNYYRAEVVSLDATSCTVTFVDYGNTESIAAADIYPCCPSLAEIPCQAFKCSLLGISPVSGSEWSPESGTVMESSMQDGATCTFLARHGDKFLVEMCQSEGLSLVDVLVQSNLAKPSAKRSQASDRSQGSRKSSSSGSFPRHVSVPTPSRLAGGAGDAASLKVSYNILPAGLTNLGLTIGDTVDGFIAHCENTDAIYIHLTKNKDEIDTMYESIATHYKGGKGVNVAEVLEDGCYVTKFSEDGEWYRSKVINIDNTNVKVFFCDYGNTETTTVSCLRQLVPAFSKMPAQALRCSLFECNDHLSGKSLKQFLDKYLYAYISGEIKHSSADCTIMEMFHEGKLLSSSVKELLLACPPSLRFTSKELSLGELQGYLVYEVSQKEFYIQLESDTDLLAEVSEKVSALSASSKQLVKPAVGEACIARFSEDEVWYRAEVTQCSSDSYDVKFVDFGNSSCVVASDVLEISKELADIPTLAIRCSLVCEDNSQNLTDWATDLLTVTVVKVVNTQAVVSLLMDSLPFISPSQDTISSTSVTATSNADSVGPSPSTTRPSLRFTSKELSLGELQGYLVYEVSQKEFYIQLESDTDLLEQVSEKVSVLSASSKQLVKPAVGEACIARFSEDGVWYRAEVTQCSSDSYDVKFVDFGNSSCVVASDVLEISKELADIPTLAIRCSLVCEDNSQNLTDWATDLLTVTVEQVVNTQAVVSLLMDSLPFISLSQDTISSTSVTATSNTDSVGPSPSTTRPSLRFTSKELSLGELQGYLVYEVSQKEFYIQLESDTDLLEEVSEKVSVLSASSKQLVKPAVGEACIARFSEDGVWYRAEVTQCSSDSYDVKFVDFGNSSCVVASDVLEISKELADISTLAIRCSLVCEDNSQNLTDWATDMITIAVEEVQQNTICVTLRDPDGVPFLTSSHDVNSVTPKHSHSSLSCVSSNSVPTLSSTSSPARSQLVSLPKNNIPPGTYKAYISHIDGADTTLYVQLSQNSELLDTITSSLATLALNAEPEVYSPVGQACICKYSADNCFYRATVSELHSERGTSTLVYVDYGTREEVVNSSVKVLPASLRQYPPVAIKCTTRQPCLTGVSAERLVQLFSGKELSVQIDGTDEPYNLTVLDLDADDLKAAGVADVGEMSSSSTFVNLTSFKYPQPALDIGSSDVQVGIGHIVSPGKFYCQFFPGDLQSLDSQLQSVYSNEHHQVLLPLDEAYQGVACVAKLQEGTYVRAVYIRGVTYPPKHCQTFLVDSGRVISILKTDLYQLHVECSTFPVQAVECSLAGVYPILGHEWGEECSTQFYEINRLNAAPTAHIVKVTKEDVSDRVTVLLTLSYGGELLAETLIHSGLCNSIPASETPVKDYCVTLCGEIKSELLSSPESKATYLSDKVSEFVQRVSPALHQQVASMGDNGEELCTAQDVVGYVSQLILSEISHKPPPPPLVARVADKTAMLAEAQNILGCLLEEVLRMNSEIVENMCEDGLVAMDSLMRSDSDDEVMPSAAVGKMATAVGDEVVRFDSSAINTTCESSTSVESSQPERSSVDDTSSLELTPVKHPSAGNTPMKLPTVETSSSPIETRSSLSTTSSLPDPAILEHASHNSPTSVDVSKSGSSLADSIIALSAEISAPDNSSTEMFADDKDGNCDKLLIRRIEPEDLSEGTQSTRSGDEVLPGVAAIRLSDSEDDKAEISGTLSGLSLSANGDDVSVLCNNDMAEELVTEREGDNITEVVSAVSVDPTEGKLEGMEKTDSVSMDVAAVVSAEECKGDPDGDKEDTVEDFPTNSESETGVAGVPGAQVLSSTDKPTEVE